MIIDFKSALRKAVQQNRVFAGTSDDQVSLIMKHGIKRNFKADELIVQEGQENHNLFLVVQGNLEVRLGNPPDDSGVQRISGIKLNKLAPGDCFGEYSLIDRMTVSADVKATTQGTLFQISGPEFKKMISANDDLARLMYKNLLVVLVKRLRKKDRELDLVMVMT
ncbi:MAG: cyclic nucleotide-binding domain-containing protein [Desulfobacterales bacterium]|nr:cyclic nucleotide-binding domain-containing protein [Desulfobacterales bacterium]